MERHAPGLSLQQQEAMEEVLRQSQDPPQTEGRKIPMWIHKKSGNNFCAFPSDADYANIITSVGVHVGKNRLQRLLTNEEFAGWHK